MWRFYSALLIVAGLGVAAQHPRGAIIHASRPVRGVIWDAQSPIPFRAAGVYWNKAAGRAVRVRASWDGESWTPWIEAQIETAENGRIGTGVVYFDAVCRFAQIDGVAEPEILFIDPGQPQSDSLSQPHSIDAPAVINREQWGCTPQTCPAKEPPLYTTVTHLIVHHTAGTNTATDWAAVIRSIWVLHVMGNGWNDIGYNYLIDPNGLLYEGRAGGDGVLGAHFSSVNSGTMGVALLGTYIDVPPPARMLDTLRTTLAWQAGKWRVDASGESLHAASGLMLNVISGHRDAGLSPKASGTTECPGNAAYSWLPQLRDDVDAQVAGDCPIAIGERNRCIGASGGPLIIPVQAPAGCGWSPTLGPAWITEFTNDREVRLQVAPNPGARRSAPVHIGGHNLTVTQSASSEPDLPCVAMRGTVTAANFDGRPVVPGSQISIFGEHLGGSDPARTTVSANGKPVTPESVSAGQINVQLPLTVDTGTAHLSVSVDGVQGPETNFWVTEAVPALFLLDAGRALAINADDATLNGPDQPVQAGRALTLYLTGVGAVDRGSPWSVAIGGLPAGKLFVGLAPLLIGVYQANVLVPSDLSSGDYPIAFTVSGVVSREATISVTR